MSRSWKILLAAGLLILCVFAVSGAAAEMDPHHAYGYTKTKAAVYSAVSPVQKTGESIPAYTVVHILEIGPRYLQLEGGAFVQASDVGLFTVFGAGGKVVYWEKDQPLYATGNQNHPIGVSIPKDTAVEPLQVMVDYYLIQWDGVYGFAPQKTAKEPPKAQEVPPVYTVLGPDTAFNDLPIKSAVSAFRLPGEQGMILSRKAGDFYAVEWENRFYYLPQEGLVQAALPEKTRESEGYADQEIPLWDIPDPDHGRVIGAVPRDTVCEMAYGINGFVQVTAGGVTGFAEESAFTYPGGNGRDRYYLFLNKSTRQLTVYRADEQGRKTDREVFRVTVAIGRITTPTPAGVFALHGRERWHSFTLSYAPYAMAYTEGRYVHGPLYMRMQESTLVRSRLADFGQMATGGCLRTPYEQVRWIYFHCPDGTTLEIVNGVQARPLQ